MRDGQSDSNVESQKFVVSDNFVGSVIGYIYVDVNRSGVFQCHSVDCFHSRNTFVFFHFFV